MGTEVDEIMEDVEIEVPEAVVGEKREGSLLEEPGTKYRKVERECRSEVERDIPEYTRLWHKEYYPWCYATRRSLADPPDINYRLIMVRHREHLDLLLMPGMHHFKERCLQYQKLDVELEVEMLEEYKEWAHSMHEISSEHWGKDREDFFIDLCDSLEEDAETVKGGGLATQTQ